MPNPKPLASVSRAIHVLDYLARQEPTGVPLTQVAQDLALNKTTVYNILSTLKSLGWADQDARTGLYSLGAESRSIAEHHAASDRMLGDIHPALEAISARFNELAHLGRLSGMSVVYLDKVEPDRAIRVVSTIGREVPAVRTALGRSLIGSLDNREDRLEWFMSDPALADHPLESTTDLRSAVRSNFLLLDRRGWTQEVEENEPGIACVAVPFTAAGIPLAISVTAPVERLPDDRAQLVAQGIAEELASLPSATRIQMGSRLVDRSR